MIIMQITKYHAFDNSEKRQWASFLWTRNNRKPIQKESFSAPPGHYTYFRPHRQIPKSTTRVFLDQPFATGPWLKHITGSELGYVRKFGYKWSTIHQKSSQILLLHRVHHMSHALYTGFCCARGVVVITYLFGGFIWYIFLRVTSLALA